MGSLAEVFFLLGSEVRNETKESPSNDRAIAPGTQVLLCCLVGESVSQGNIMVGSASVSRTHQCAVSLVGYVLLVIAGALVNLRSI